VNQHCFLEILERLHEAVCQILPELWPDAWILHHDTALAHDALAVWEFLAKKIDNEIGPSTIFARFGPCDFWLFPKLKPALEGHTFSDIADIQGQSSYRAFQKRSSRNVLSSANTDSLSVLVHKETTSKVTATISV
jgi:hypothetical protein